MSVQNVITFLSLLVNILAIITFYITLRKYMDDNKRGEMIGDYYVTGSILRCYRSFHGKVHLGKPLTEEFRAMPSPYHTQGFVQRFEGYGDDVEFEHRGKKFRGISIYKSWRGTYAVYGNIGQAYEEQDPGGTSSRLGFPRSNEKVENGLVRQYFEGGYITGNKDIVLTRR